MKHSFFEQKQQDIELVEQKYLPVMIKRQLEAFSSTKLPWFSINVGANHNYKAAYINIFYVERLNKVRINLNVIIYDALEICADPKKHEQYATVMQTLTTCAGRIIGQSKESLAEIPRIIKWLQQFKCLAELQKLYTNGKDNLTEENIETLSKTYPLAFEEENPIQEIILAIRSTRDAAKGMELR
jgi:hypothetical protein